MTEELKACPIPDNVYYSREHDNFYSLNAHKGQGHAFYREWSHRRSEFPDDPRLNLSSLSPSRESGEPVAYDHQRVFDALTSAGGLIRALCSDDVAKVAIAELSYVNSVLATPPTVAEDEVSKLKVEVERMRKASEWQAIETAPKDGTKFDAWVPDAFGGKRMTCLSFNARGQLRQNGLLTAAELPRWPTHWRPLPAPPALHEVEEG